MQIKPFKRLQTMEVLPGLNITPKLFPRTHATSTLQCQLFKYTGLASTMFSAKIT